jgi:Type I phosphodiesterase / nucleotide pyrophosphatase
MRLLIGTMNSVVAWALNLLQQFNGYSIVSQRLLWCMASLWRTCEKLVFADFHIASSTALTRSTSKSSRSFIPVAILQRGNSEPDMPRHLSLACLRALTCACFLLFGGAAFTQAAERPSARVLFIGIDGCRRDALAIANVPNLRALIDAGAFSEATNIVGVRSDKADTVSGPGWSNLLTGVWADKHGVVDNKFTAPHYDTYPHFFHYVKAGFPGAVTCSYCTWEPIEKRILSAADDSQFFSPGPKDSQYPVADEKCAAKAMHMLSEGDPDVMFVYLGSVDQAGHDKGFHPSVPQYRQALETVDQRVGTILTAMRSRPRFEAERWLVIVATDHGGRGTGHGGGRSVPEINTVFLIVSGAGAAKGPIAGATNQVDVVATALAHLGIAMKPEWKLDGQPVGLSAAAVH